MRRAPQAPAVSRILQQSCPLALVVGNSGVTRWSSKRSGSVLSCVRKKCTATSC